MPQLPICGRYLPLRSQLPDDWIHYDRQYRVSHHAARLKSCNLKIGCRGRRHRFSANDKARIIETTLVAGTIVSDVARQHGLSPQQLFTWCRQARRPAVKGAETEVPNFVPAVVDPERSDGAIVRQKRQRAPGRSGRVESSRWRSTG